MTISFDRLSKATQERLIKAFRLPENEERVLMLRYVFGFSYTRIAAEMNVSQKSVGPMLTRTRAHVIEIARECYELADEDTRKAIDMLGWREIEWPIIYNRNKLKRE